MPLLNPFRYILHHRALILYTLLCTLLAVILVNYSQDIGLRVFDFMAARQEKQLVSYLEKDKDYVYQSVLATSKRPDLRASIEHEDTATLLSIFEEELAKHGLSQYAATDSKGTALSRGPIHSTLGDDIFLTNPLGRIIVKQGHAVGFTTARAFPLTIAAGTLITEPDKVLGSVFGGYWLDNSYAEAFKKKYLDDIRKREVVFYSTDEGVIGDSLNNQDTRNKLRAYINHASAFTQAGRAGELIEINGTDYVVSNHVIADDYTVYGGVLLLTPVPGTVFTRSFSVSLLIAILFFLSLLSLEKISLRRFIQFKRGSLYSALGILTVIVFSSVWGGVYSYGKTIITNLDQPKITIYNSTMKLRPESGVYILGYQQQASIQVYSGGEKINAIEAHLNFDPSVIHVDSLSLDRSICSPEEVVNQDIDNTAGTITITCAIVGNAFSDAKGVVADINFTPIHAGNAIISFGEDTHVSAADGLGTDVLRSVTSGFYRVFNEKDIDSLFSSDAIVIPYSPTHPNSAKWYSGRRVLFTWPMMKNVAYEYELSTDASSTIAHPTRTSKNEVALTAPADGVYYFKLRAVSGQKVGAVSRFVIHIDNTPPALPLIKASSLFIKRKDIVRFELDSDDELSGLQKNFYVKVDDGVWQPTNSRIYMPFSQTGDHVVSVRVFDNAENYSDSSVTISVRN